MSDIRLRGNTFILLLLRSHSHNLSTIEGWGKKGQGITKPNMFLELLRMIDASHSPKMPTLSKYFSEFMSGARPNSHTAYPFLEPTFTHKFKIRMQCEYGGVLKEMDVFCHRYLDYNNDSSMKQLVAGLTIAIDEDPTIPKNTQFNTGTSTIRKKDLLKHRDFKLQPFLLSIWYYLVTEKPDASEAKQTYLDWTGEAETNSAPPITTTIGLERAEIFPFQVDMTTASNITEAAPTAETNPTIETEHPELAEETEQVHSDCSDDSTDTADTIDEFADTSTQQQPPQVVYQTINNWNNAEGGTQIGHVEKLEIKM